MYEGSGRFGIGANGVSCICLYLSVLSMAIGWLCDDIPCLVVPLIEMETCLEII